VLDDALIDRYAAWCRERTDSEDERWLQQKRRALAWWRDVLKGRSLATVTLSRILDALDTAPTRRDRIVAIKHLYSYLRQTDQVSASDDPTLDALPVPQSRPEQDTTGQSKVISEEEFRATLPCLDQRYADICRLMAGTGCHLSEALRFMAAGGLEDRPGQFAVVAFKHKGGHIHRVEVTAPVAVAARRLLGTKAPARESVYRAIRAACTKASVPDWTPGRFRHTFATSAISAACPPNRGAGPRAGGNHVAEVVRDDRGRTARQQGV
jgi:integrase